MHVGGIRMLRNEEKQWELQVDHSLFAIKKLDITVSIMYAEFFLLLQGHRVSMWGSKYWNYSTCLDHGLCRGEREGRYLNVQSLYHRK